MEQKDLQAAINRSYPVAKAVAHNDVLYISGQVGVDWETNTLVNNSFAAETHQVLKNLERILHSHSLGFGHLISVTIYLVSMDQYAEVNDIYQSYFKDTFPARVCIAVYQLPLGATVEICALARLS